MSQTMLFRDVDLNVKTIIKCKEVIMKKIRITVSSKGRTGLSSGRQGALVRYFLPWCFLHEHWLTNNLLNEIFMFCSLFWMCITRHNYTKGWKTKTGKGEAIESLAVNIARHKPGWNAKVNFSLFNMAMCSKCKMTIV